jgi:hypothetical protein
LIAKKPVTKRVPKTAKMMETTSETTSETTPETTPETTAMASETTPETTAMASATTPDTPDMPESTAIETPETTTSETPDTPETWEARALRVIDDPHFTYSDADPDAKNWDMAFDALHAKGFMTITQDPANPQNSLFVMTPHGREVLST